MAIAVERRLRDHRLERGDAIFDTFVIDLDVFPTNRQIAAVNRRLDKMGVRQ